jgi:enoyl-CoA hydratase
LLANLPQMEPAPHLAPSVHAAVLLERAMTSPLQYELVDGIATLTLDDGKANVMSVAMLTALHEALARAESEQAMVVIRGRPGMFSGGFDLSVFKRDRKELFQMLKLGADLTERLLSFPLPVVAVCTGHAIAMGVFLLLSADVRLGIQADAKVQANEVQIGLTLPHFAIAVCRQRLAPAHFNQAAITAHPYDPPQALAAGFLDELATPEALPAALKRRTDHLRSLNREAFTTTKLRLRAPALAALREAIARDVADWSGRFGGDA